MMVTSIIIKNCSRDDIHVVQKSTDSRENSRQAASLHKVFHKKPCYLKMCRMHLVCYSKQYILA